MLENTSKESRKPTLVKSLQIQPSTHAHSTYMSALMLIHVYGMQYLLKYLVESFRSLNCVRWFTPMTGSTLRHLGILPRIPVNSHHRRQGSNSWTGDVLNEHFTPTLSSYKDRHFADPHYPDFNARLSPSREQIFMTLGSLTPDAMSPPDLVSSFFALLYTACFTMPVFTWHL